ncbi:MAG: hypothetical protein LWW92_02520, partial [Rhodocyclales bacterium]|nr:hypothetical protein [Rhodocyclales bacterium]
VLLSPQQTVPIAGGFSISPNQIRLSGVFSGGMSYPIREIGVWSGDPSVVGAKLVAYWSQASGDLATKSAGVDFIFSYDMVLDATLPASSISVLADMSQSVLLAHEARTDPHPQYTTEAKVNSLIEARVGDYVVSTNSGNAYSVVLDPAIGTYSAKTSFAFKASATNTGAATINAGAGPKGLLREDGNVLIAGDVVLNTIVTVVFDTSTDSFRITEVVASQTAAAIQSQAYTAFSAGGGAPNFTLTPTPAATAYSAGLRYRVKFGGASGSGATLNVSGLGVKSLKQYDAAGVKVGAVIAANQLVDLEYDGVDFVLLNPLPFALGNMRAAAVVTAPIVLTSVDVGKCYSINSGGSLTLPLATTVPSGSMFLVYATVATSVSRQGSDTIYIGSSSTEVVVNLNVGDWALIGHNGFQWQVFAGSVLMPYSLSFSSMKGDRGFQKMPGGLIFQWWGDSFDATGVKMTTFPIAFPNGVFHVSGHAMMDRGGVSPFDVNIIGWDPSNTSLVAARMVSIAYNGSYMAGGERFFAIGY